MNGKKVTTIVFDIGGVLLDIHPEKTYQYISDSTDINIDIVKKDFLGMLTMSMKKAISPTKSGSLLFESPCLSHAA